MSGAMIGIKLADSKFFPVLTEDQPASKILDLTTVRDNQTSVQINLFRNGSETIENAEYVGTLIIEDIAEKPAGEPTVELSLSLNDRNELSAEAVDLESGSRQALNVSLETLDKNAQYNLPDFDLTTMNSSVQLGDDPDHENVVLEGTIPGNAPEGLYEMNGEEEKKGGITIPAWLTVVILVVSVLALILSLLVLGRTMLLNRTIEEKVAQAVEVPAVPVVEPAPALPETPAQPETPPPVETPSTAPAEAVVVETPAAPVQPEPVAEAKDTHYKIKWGDTLWDIADAYYRNPWLYPKIAKYNKIKNPNLIISGTYIDIPAK